MASIPVASDFKKPESYKVKPGVSEFDGHPNSGGRLPINRPPAPIDDKVAASAAAAAHAGKQLTGKRKPGTRGGAAIGKPGLGF